MNEFYTSSSFSFLPSNVSSLRCSSTSTAEASPRWIGVKIIAGIRMALRAMGKVLPIFVNDGFPPVEIGVHVVATTAVFSMRNRFKMRRVYAITHSTKVVNLQAIRDHTYEKFVNNSVRNSGDAFRVAETSVTLFVAVSNPLPTAVREYLYLRLYADRQFRDIVVCRHLLIVAGGL